MPSSDECQVSEADAPQSHLALGPGDLRID